MELQGISQEEILEPNRNPSLAETRRENYSHPQTHMFSSGSELDLTFPENPAVLMIGVSRPLIKCCNI